MPTRSQKIATDLTALFRARNPLIWLVTREEARVERYIHEAAANAAYITRSWDVAQGVTEIGGKPPARPIGSKDPGEMLDAIMARAMTETQQERAVWIMRDLPAWIQGPQGIVTLRQLRNLARALPGRPRDCGDFCSLPSAMAVMVGNQAELRENSMGDRGNIAIEEDGKRIYFYSHWSGSELPEIVRRAIARKWRWDDPPYLARIIFCELVKGNEGEETGYGISLGICDNSHPIIVVDMNKQSVTLDGGEAKGFKELPFPIFAALEAATFKTFKA